MKEGMKEREARNEKWPQNARERTPCGQEITIAKCYGIPYRF